ncbi:MAG: GNAT family N-acetyltransferase [Gammaproteobacteria bacterium]|nr:GNAT family N-acetyltransferase [Gammaproteobacteria bacterium]
MSRLPELLETPRLLLRVPEPGDAEPLNAAITASFAELTQWMPWAAEQPSVAQTGAFCAEARENWESDLRYGLIMVEKDGGAIVGGSGYPNIDWSVPKFEIGYWCRTSIVGRGYASEATRALARLAFDEMDAVRVELRMDDGNRGSWRVAERMGFELEGVLRGDSRSNSGSLCSTRIYSLVDPTRLRDVG